MKEVIWTPGWGPDTLIKILPDMDKAFFNGLLRHRVQVSWEDEASVRSLGIPDFANKMGVTAFHHDNKTAHIRLNRRAVCFHSDGPRSQMLQTLVHELVVSINGTVPIIMR